MESQEKEQTQHNEANALTLEQRRDDTIPTSALASSGRSYKYLGTNSPT